MENNNEDTSQNMTHVHLDLWFKDQLGTIIIFLNSYDNKCLSEEDRLFRNAFLDKYWIFLKTNKETKKSEYEMFPIKTKFYYDKKEVDLEKYHKYLLDLKSYVNKEFVFPDIKINKDEVDSIAFDKDNPTEPRMYLSPEVFSDFDRFRFSIGHELAHLTFPEKEYEHKFKNIFFNFDPVQCIMIFNFIMIGWSAFNIKSSADALATMIMTIPMIPLIFFIYFSYITFEERMMNYTKEFFCDFYSIRFTGTVESEFLGLENFEFNVFSHPSNNHRISFYKKACKEFNLQTNTFNTSATFHPPNISHPFLFKYLSMFEIHMLLNPKFKKIIKKKS